MAAPVLKTPMPYSVDGERDERERVYAANLGLVERCIRRWRGHPMYEDLEIVAELALWRAAGRYDARRRTAFSTYALTVMHGAVLNEFRDHGLMIHIPGGRQARGDRGPVVVSLDGLRGWEEPGRLDSDGGGLMDELEAACPDAAWPMLRMWAEGWSQREIGERYGVSQITVSKRLMRLKVKVRCVCSSV